jgi:Zn-dependent protease
LFTLPNLLLAAPMLLLSVIAHEYAHGYAALRQGDPTARELGRLTWNPIKHIDPFLTILMPIVTAYSMGVMFGGAKPVPVDPRRYRDYRRGDIIVSLAGVATNAVIAVACVIVFGVVGAVGSILPGTAGVLAVVQQMLLFGVLINALLIGFNLLPIPPLDGSHVVKHMLPPAWAVQYQRIGAAGLLILILLISFARGVLSAWLYPFFEAARWLLMLVRPLALGTA